VGAVYRLLEMGIEPFMVASSVIGVLAQRLVRRLCDRCSIENTPPVEEMSFYASLGGRQFNFRRGTGCAYCSHTGFRDRIGIFEVLRMSDAVKRLIVKEAPPEALRQLAAQEGMQALRQAGLIKIDEGVTTIAEVMRSVNVG
jgi:type IV pilus assembly protein PilB